MVGDVKETKKDERANMNLVILGGRDAGQKGKQESANIECGVE